MLAPPASRGPHARRPSDRTGRGLLATLAVVFGLALPAAGAQEGEPKHVPSRSFQIPFTTSHDPNVQEYQLWVWQAGGWVFQARAVPGDRAFEVRVTSDGLYTFADRIVYMSDGNIDEVQEQPRPLLGESDE